MGVKDVATSNLQEIRLFPSFVLQASIVDPNTGSVVRKEYLDRLMPYVTKQIQESEDPAIKLFNTVELSSKPLYRKGDEKFAVGREVWGVAVWEDVHPRADYVSIQIQGLTNAFEVEQGQESKDFAFKTLQLNFYRPGDSIDESSESLWSTILRSKSKSAMPINSPGRFWWPLKLMHPTIAPTGWRPSLRRRTEN